MTSAKSTNLTITSKIYVSMHFYMSRNNVGEYSVLLCCLSVQCHLNQNCQSCLNGKHFTQLKNWLWSVQSMTMQINGTMNGLETELGFSRIRIFLETHFQSAQQKRVIQDCTPAEEDIWIESQWLQDKLKPCNFMLMASKTTFETMIFYDQYIWKKWWRTP